MTGKIRALIVDDEPPARRRIRDLLEDEPDVEVVGECGDGAQAVAAIEAARPELVFLDVQMPEGGGFEVVRALGPERLPAVVFVTAYDRYAVQAFEVHALDYLLKPFDRERFRAAMQRARDALRRPAAGGPDPRLLALLEELRPAPRGLDRIPVRIGPRIRLVPVDEVDYFRAETNYVRLHLGDRSHLVRDTLSGVEARLDPARFLRVHRSLIVNLARVREVEPLFAGEYVLTLQDGTRLTSGRSFRARIQEALNLKA
ncbi:MAG TPA: LytTR family DNA-binding domain-containing protein [Longimicrobiaceae bacterium]|nr:LytTR family DNA-binding domain-containing protein [Longimicrobiaceae bacterium]